MQQTKEQFIEDLCTRLKDKPVAFILELTKELSTAQKEELKEALNNESKDEEE